MRYQTGVPVYHAVTPANFNDITAAKAMPIERGATDVFDLGHYDYGWWAPLEAAQCRIVTRFKANTPLIEARDMPSASRSPSRCSLTCFSRSRQESMPFWR